MWHNVPTGNFKALLFSNLFYKGGKKLETFQKIFANLMFSNTYNRKEIGNGKI